jgi:hypothetical protein
MGAPARTRDIPPEGFAAIVILFTGMPVRGKFFMEKG